MYVSTCVRVCDDFTELCLWFLSPQIEYCDQFHNDLQVIFLALDSPSFFFFSSLSLSDYNGSSWSVFPPAYDLNSL